ncbi:MAG: EAL domain-containing protein [Campylobacterales bacterium]
MSNARGVSDYHLLNEYKRAVDVSNIVSKTDPAGIITYVNEKFCEISGYRREELIGHPHNIIRHPDTPAETFRRLWETIGAKQIWHGIVKNRAKDGHAYYVDSTIVPILNDRGDIVEFIAIRKDVTELIRQRETIRQQTTDPLTGLPNRISLLGEIETSAHPALAILNIDRFKAINDFYGLKTGDRLLIEVTEFIQGRLHASQRLFKLSGDEYAVLCADCQELESFSNLIKQTLKAIAEHRFSVDWHEIRLNMTGGLAHGREGLYLHADIALGSARAGGALLQHYDPQLKVFRQYHENLVWAERLKEALEGQRVVPYFQPIYNYRTKKVDKFEALVRLINESREPVSPFFFLEVAYQTRQNAALSQAVITKTFERFSALPFDFTINLTVEDIRNAEVTALLERLALEHSDPRRVIIEITESRAIENFDEVNAFIGRMRRIGCRIAIDDFGTGYSNFNCLVKLNADIIKIDGSIIEAAQKDPASRLIAELIIDYAHKTGKEVVAEFVSDREIFELVRALGVDYAQGFYIGKPDSEPLTHFQES